MQESKIEEIIKKYTAQIIGDKVYFNPYIPQDKLKNALASYGQSLKAEEVLILIDITAFGNAKNGMIITENNIFFKELMGNASVLDLYLINSVSLDEYNYLLINGNKIFQTSFKEAETIHKIVNLLNELAEIKQTIKESEKNKLATNSKNLGSSNDNAIINTEINDTQLKNNPIKTNSSENQIPPMK